MTVVGAQRGFPPPSRESYDRDTDRQGGLLVGSPEEIAERILLMHEHWGHVRQYIHIDMGAVPQKDLLHAIELFGTEVRPLVQKEIGSTTVAERMGRSPLEPEITGGDGGI
ncbi:hypothetical protein KAE78_03650 [Microbacterium sp. NIBRBAC000506063]|nr:hypothetical protein KAE78_03650 [Microbacterium sp. NIBRBAC000506063]